MIFYMMRRYKRINKIIGWFISVLTLFSSLISFFCSFTAVFKRLTCFCKVLTFYLCMQSTQELPCSGVKIRNGVTAERGVSLISVVQLIFADVEATGEVKWVVHARRGAAIVTLDAVEIVLMELSWMSLESEHGFFSTLSSTTSWKSNELELDALASSTFLFFASISYSVNTSRLNYSQNIINSDRLRLTLSKDDWKSLLTWRFLRSVNSSETSDTTACIVGIEPLMRTLFRFVFAIPSRVNAKLFS